MKKLLCIITSLLLLLLCSCGEDITPDNPEDVTALNSAVAAANAETRIKGEYMLEITFGDGAVLYYALGDVAWDRTAEKATATFNQTYLGASSEMQNIFEKGKMISTSNGETLETERESAELFSKFPYFLLPDYSEDCKNLVAGSNTKGKTFGFNRTDTKTLCESVVGGDIYELVTVLKKPQKDKAEYGEAKCVYTVADGKVASCRYEFDIKLYDTPSYVPGYTPPESEYTLNLHVVAKVSYFKFGSDVEIEEFSE